MLRAKRRTTGSIFPHVYEISKNTEEMAHRSNEEDKMPHLIECTSDESDGETLPKRASNISEGIDMWFKLAKKVRQKHQDVAKIHMLSSFMFGEVYQDDLWLEWAEQCKIRSPNADDRVDELTDKQLEIIDQLIKAMDLLSKQLNNKSSLKEVLDCIQTCVTKKMSLDDMLTHMEKSKKFFSVASQLDLAEKRPSQMIVMLAALQYTDSIKKMVLEGKSLPDEYKQTCNADKHKMEELKKKGNDEFLNGNYKRAITQYTKAINQSHFNHVLYSNRAQAYLKSNEHRKALSDSKRSIVLEPTWTKGHHRYAQALFELGKKSEALAANKRGLDVCSKGDNKMVELLEQQRNTFSNGRISTEKKSNEPKFKFGSVSNGFPKSDESDSDVPELVSSDSDSMDRLTDDESEISPVKTKKEEKTKTQPKTWKSRSDKKTDADEAPPPLLTDSDSDDDHGRHNRKLPPRQEAELMKGIEERESKRQAEKKRLQAEKRRQQVDRLLLEQEKLKKKEAELKKRKQEEAKKRTKKVEEERLQKKREEEARRAAEKLRKLMTPDDIDREKFNNILWQGSEALIEKRYRNAIQYYQECLEKIEKRSVKFYKLEDDQYLVLLYSYGVANVDTGSQVEILEAISKFELILNQYKRIKFPLAYLGLGKAMIKQNRYTDALVPLNKGIFVVKDSASFGVYNWPGTLTFIDDTLPGKLKIAFECAMETCKHPPKPDAICRYSDCHGYYKVQIYFTDPDFKGFVRTLCYANCAVDFHPTCWRKVKSAGGEKLSDKDYLNLSCFTPDCPAAIYKIQVYEDTGDVKKTFEAPPLIPERKIIKPQKKLPPSSLKVIERRRERKETRKRLRAEQGKKSQSIIDVIDDLKDGANSEATNTENKENDKPNDIGFNEADTPLPPIVDSNYVTVLKKDEEEEDLFKGVKTKSKKKKKAKTPSAVSLTGYFSQGKGLEDLEEDTGGAVNVKYSELDSKNPFSVPTHLKQDIAKFESEYRPPTTPEVLQARNLDKLSSETINIQDNLFSFFAGYLKGQGPVALDDIQLQRELDLFPAEALELIKSAGGLGRFLTQSLQFALMEDVVCLMTDAVRAKKIAEQRKQTLRQSQLGLDNFPEMGSISNPSVNAARQASLGLENFPEIGSAPNAGANVAFTQQSVNSPRGIMPTKPIPRRDSTSSTSSSLNFPPFSEISSEHSSRSNSPGAPILPDGKQPLGNTSRNTPVRNPSPGLGPISKPPGIVSNPNIINNPLSATVSYLNNGRNTNNGFNPNVNFQINGSNQNNSHNINNGFNSNSVYDQSSDDKQKNGNTNVNNFPSVHSSLDWTSSDLVTEKKTNTVMTLGSIADTVVKTSNLGEVMNPLQTLPNAEMTKSFSKSADPKTKSNDKSPGLGSENCKTNDLSQPIVDIGKTITPPNVPGLIDPETLYSADPLDILGPDSKGKGLEMTYDTPSVNTSNNSNGSNKPTNADIDTVKAKSPSLGTSDEKDKEAVVEDLRRQIQMKLAENKATDIDTVKAKSPSFATPDEKDKEAVVEDLRHQIQIKLAENEATEACDKKIKEPDHLRNEGNNEGTPTVSEENATKPTDTKSEEITSNEIDSNMNSEIEQNKTIEKTLENDSDIETVHAWSKLPEVKYTLGTFEDEISQLKQSLIGSKPEMYARTSNLGVESCKEQKLAMSENWDTMSPKRLDEKIESPPGHEDKDTALQSRFTQQNFMEQSSYSLFGNAGSMNQSGFKMMDKYESIGSKLDSGFGDSQDSFKANLSPFGTRMNYKTPSIEGSENWDHESLSSLSSRNSSHSDIRSVSAIGVIGDKSSRLKASALAEPDLATQKVNLDLEEPAVQLDDDHEFAREQTELIMRNLSGHIAFNDPSVYKQVYNDILKDLKNPLSTKTKSEESKLNNPETIVKSLPGPECNKATQAAPIVCNKACNTLIYEPYKHEYVEMLRDRENMAGHLQTTLDKYTQLQNATGMEIRMLKESVDELQCTKEELERELKDTTKSLKDVTKKHKDDRKAFSDEVQAVRTEIKALKPQQLKLQNDIAARDQDISKLKVELRDAKGVHQAVMSQLQEEKLLECSRAEHAEVEVLQLKRNINIEMHDRSIKEADTRLSQLVSMLKKVQESNQPVPPPWMKLLTDWKARADNLRSKKDNILAVFDEQIKLVKSGKNLGTLPELNIPPPQPPSEFMMRPPVPLTALPARRMGPPLSMPLRPPGATPPGIQMPPGITLPSSASMPSMHGPPSGSVTPPPYISLPPGGVMAPPKSSFEKIMLRIQSMFPKYTRTEITKFIQDVRAARSGSLSGMSLDDIIQHTTERILQCQVTNQQGGAVKSPPPVFTMTRDPRMPDPPYPSQRSREATPTQEIFHEEEDPCIICHDEMTPQTSLLLRCGHRFHESCIKTWFKEQSTCPTCRVHALLPEEFPSLR